MSLVAPDLEHFRAAYPRLEELEPPWWIAGGAIRDAILRRERADLDLVISSLHQAEEFAARVEGRIVRMGREIPSIRVVEGTNIWDFAPIQGATIVDDAARRDFTINAMALGSDGSFVDPFDGVIDCEREIVRMVDEKNLDDDPLRCLRAVRFSATLRFRIDADTALACRARAGTIHEVAGERIGHELRKTLLEGDPMFWIAGLVATGLDEELLKVRLDEEAPLPRESLAALTTLLVARSAEERDEIRSVIVPGRTDLRHVFSALKVLDEEEDSVLLRAHREGPEATSLALEAAKTTGRERLAGILRSETSREGFFGIRPLLTGEELAGAAGVEEGPELGALVEEMMREQLAGRLTTREQALEWARSDAQ